MVNIHNDGNDKEWIRRRQIRLLQVRKQSDDIAKQLRERISNEENQRRIHQETEIETKFQRWKVRRLHNLEEMYRNAITELGSGHKLAAEDINTSQLHAEKQKKNIDKAKERGDTALKQHLKEKKESSEMRNMPIERKKIIRQIEDIRSSLVRTIPVSQKILLPRKNDEEKTFNPKLFESCTEKHESVNKMDLSPEKKDGEPTPVVITSSSKCVWNEKFKLRKVKAKNRVAKKNILGKELQCKTKRDIQSQTSLPSCPRTEKPWVHLPVVEAQTEGGEETEEDMTTVDLELKGNEGGIRSSENIVKCKKKRVLQAQKENVCFAYSLRDNCKYRNNAYSVRRTCEEMEPDPNEMAQIEEEKLMEEKALKEYRQSEAEERGNKALEREKIAREYNDLLAKLGKLSTREKLIRSYCRVSSPHIFMSDERRQELDARRQKIMDSQFERIYCDAIGASPEADLHSKRNYEPYTKGLTIDPEDENGVTTIHVGHLQSNLETNSPSSSIHEIEAQESGQCSLPDSPKVHISVRKTPKSLSYRRTKVAKGRRRTTLSLVDKILEKGRKIRNECRKTNEMDQDESKSVPEPVQKKMGDKDEAHSLEDCIYEIDDLGSVESETYKLDTSEKYGDADLSEIFKLSKDGGTKSSKRSKSIWKDLGCGDFNRPCKAMRNTIAWPVQPSKQSPSKSLDDSSFCTRYRDLPPEMLDENIDGLLRELGHDSEREGGAESASADPNYTEIILKTLGGIEDDACAIFQEIEASPRLRKWVEKLLSLRREFVADLESKRGECPRHKHKQVTKQVTDNERSCPAPERSRMPPQQSCPRQERSRPPQQQSCPRQERSRTPPQQSCPREERSRTPPQQSCPREERSRTPPQQVCPVSETTRTLPKQPCPVPEQSRTTPKQPCPLPERSQTPPQQSCPLRNRSRTFSERPCPSPDRPKPTTEKAPPKSKVEDYSSRAKLKELIELEKDIQIWKNIIEQNLRGKHRSMHTLQDEDGEFYDSLEASREALAPSSFQEESVWVSPHVKTPAAKCNYRPPKVETKPSPQCSRPPSAGKRVDVMEVCNDVTCPYRKDEWASMEPMCKPPANSPASNCNSNNNNNAIADFVRKKMLEGEALCGSPKECDRSRAEPSGSRPESAPKEWPSSFENQPSQKSINCEEKKKARQAVPSRVFITTLTGDDEGSWLDASKCARGFEIVTTPGSGPLFRAPGPHGLDEKYFRPAETSSCESPPGPKMTAQDWFESHMRGRYPDKPSKVLDAGYGLHSPVNRRKKKKREKEPEEEEEELSGLEFLTNNKLIQLMNADLECRRKEEEEERQKQMEKMRKLNQARRRMYGYKSDDDTSIEFDWNSNEPWGDKDTYLREKKEMRKAMNIPSPTDYPLSPDTSHLWHIQEVMSPSPPPRRPPPPPEPEPEEDSWADSVPATPPSSSDPSCSIR